MPDKTYLVRFKEPDFAPQIVRAATIEIHGQHLVFCLAGGELSALFLLEIVENWEELRDIGAT
jgi:hypothetical protein